MPAISAVLGCRNTAGRRIAAATVGAALALTACSGGTDSTEPPPRTLPDLTLAAALTPFGSCDAFLAWVQAEARERVTAYGFGGGPVYYLEDGVAARAPGAPVPGPATTVTAAEARARDTEGGDGGGADYSGTNVQVEGVDEPDVVKTDGELVVALAQGKIHVVDAASARHLGAVDVQDGWASEMLLSGDRLLVLGQAWEAMPLPGIRATEEGRARSERMIMPPGEPGSILTEIDLSDPAQPTITGSVVVEGSYLSARMVGDVARVVVRSDPQTSLGFVYPAGPGEAAEARALEVNRRVIDESTVDDWLPRYTAYGPQGEQTGEGTLVDCEDAHQPREFAGFGILGVVTVDLSEGLDEGVEARNAAAVMAGGETVYASTEHLYVATTEYVDWERLSDAERQRIDADYGTELHRFDISDPEDTRYEVSGRVDGHLLNQFSLDEHEGVLRVATTKGSPWTEGEGTSESAVVTFAERDGALVEVGRVGGLGRGETIHSVRFLGDVGYVVTFRQTDPLYTVDLRDPAAPRVVGELKILGFSAYLHPIGDGFLLGVGQDATEEGRRLGTQVALFDVRDPAAPARVAQVTMPLSSSTVEWDHRAFLWWAREQLAVVPMEQFGEPMPVEPGAGAAGVAPNEDVWPASGAIGFDVDRGAAAITERGRISHAGRGTGYPLITRSLVIGDTLWTLSESGLLASDLRTFADTAWITF